MNQSIIGNLIKELQKARSRPALYMGEVTVAAFHAFHNGLRTAYFAFGIRVPLELVCQVTTDRGWEFGSQGGVPHMREQGLTEEQTVAELLLIEIGILELVAKDYQGAA